MCPVCRAAHDHPLFHCKANARHLPTHGDACAECAWIAEANARREARDAPIRESLERIRAAHVADWGKAWPGCEFGKAIVGMALTGAIRDLGGAR